MTIMIIKLRKRSIDLLRSLLNDAGEYSMAGRFVLAYFY
jgi:hypothetical protein